MSRKHQLGRTLLQVLIVANVVLLTIAGTWLWYDMSREKPPDPPVVLFAVDAELGQIDCAESMEGLYVCAIPLTYTIRDAVDGSTNNTLECSLTVQYPGTDGRMLHHRAVNRFPIKPSDYLLEKRTFFSFTFEQSIGVKPQRGPHECVAVKLDEV